MCAIFRTLSAVSSPFRAEPAVPITPDYIRKIRKSLALTQAKFGERLGVSASTVSAWERGKSKPQPAPASKLRELAAKAK
ncbi:helix-turn-helix domain-containing protein [Victivallis sp. Marseille-Q1083]|uniref:helix-turn-helix domain-containing protein n=1 Tax=Victivallis sp. Marseille-Q1083 TaxID=2717288 RepID=UPI00158A05BC